MKYLKTTKIWIAIRRDMHNGLCWLDECTVSPSMLGAQLRVEDLSSRSPGWSQDNPVVDIVQATISIDFPEEEEEYNVK